MENIIFKHVKKTYGKTEVVKDLSLEVKEGERLILLGPSGCGKSTTLRMLAGLESITEGEIEVGGKVINELTPGERNVAMVFQSYALFPHLSVWENIVFGLKIQKLSKEEIRKRASKALEILDLIGFEEHKPQQLSGGQKQRVALCRALVKQSKTFLLDEPLSNLDAKLRQQARTELVKIHEIYKPTMIYVTHDQVEAMTVADRIAILNKGDLQQIGTPREIYHAPANTFVAGFIGTPPMNLLEVIIKNDKLFVGKDFLEVPFEYRKFIQNKESVFIGIRPENCQLSCKPMLKALVSYVENLGNQSIVKLELPTKETVNVISAAYNENLDDIRGFSFDWDNVSWFDSSTKENLEKKGGN